MASQDKVAPTVVGGRRDLREASGRAGAWQPVLFSGWFSLLCSLLLMPAHSSPLAQTSPGPSTMCCLIHMGRLTEAEVYQGRLWCLHLT